MTDPHEGEARFFPETELALAERVVARLEAAIWPGDYVVVEERDFGDTPRRVGALPNARRDETELVLAGMVAARQHGKAIDEIESFPRFGDTNDYAYRLGQPDNHEFLI